MEAFSETVARHLHSLGQFPRLRDRALYVYGRILRRFRWPLPGRHKTVQVNLHPQHAPLHLRLGSTDWLVLDEIFQKGEYSVVRDAIKDACWIVDLGANVGYSLRYWLMLFPGAQIIALEPEPDNFSVCSRNIRSGGLGNQVTLLQAAVGASRGRMRLVDTGEGEWAYRTDGKETAGGRSVEVLPLSEVLADHARGQKIDLLKCDIEGAEKELFEGCSPWIGQVEAIIIELHPPYCLPDLMAALGKAGADFEVSAQIDRKSCPVVLLRGHQSVAEKFRHAFGHRSDHDEEPAGRSS